MKEEWEGFNPVSIGLKRKSGAEHEPNKRARQENEGKSSNVGKYFFSLKEETFEEIKKRLASDVGNNKTNVEQEQQLEMPEIYANSHSEANPKHPKINGDNILNSDKVYGLSDGHSIDKKDFGRRASQIVLKKIKKLFIEGENSSLNEAKLRVYNALIEADIKLYDANVRNYLKREDPYSYTTASIGIFYTDKVNGKTYFIAGNVGDSRIYLYRNGKLTQITIDDGPIRDVYNLDNSGNDWQSKCRELQLKWNNTKYPYQKHEGESDLDFSRRKDYFNRRNTMNQRLGDDKVIEPRITSIEVQEGDVICFMSDGVTDPLRFDQIEKIFKKGLNINQLPMELVKSAIGASMNTLNQNRKFDDASALAIGVGKGSEASGETSDQGLGETYLSYEEFLFISTIEEEFKKLTYPKLGDILESPNEYGECWITGVNLEEKFLQITNSDSDVMPDPLKPMPPLTSYIKFSDFNIRALT